MRIQKTIQQTNLTKRETEILKLISNGYINKEIAKMLYLSIETVKSHRKNMLSKLNAKNSAHLIKISYEKNFLKSKNYLLSA